MCIVLQAAISMSSCCANSVVAKKLSMGIVDAVGGVPVQLLLGRQLGQVSFCVTHELTIIAAACTYGGAKPG